MQGAIFDLDGTLLDSMGMWSQIDVEFLAKRGIALPSDYQDAVTPLGALDAAHYTIARFGLSDTPYALEYVKALHARGIPITIATSSAYKSVYAACERTNLLRYIRRIVTVADVGKTKEHPDIYLACAEETGCAPHACVVYEDIIEGVHTAVKAGFFTVGILEPGYSQQEQSYCELIGVNLTWQKKTTVPEAYRFSKGWKQSASDRVCISEVPAGKA